MSSPARFVRVVETEGEVRGEVRGEVGVAWELSALP